jgi:hypothetical protein
VHILMEISRNRAGVIGIACTSIACMQINLAFNYTSERNTDELIRPESSCCPRVMKMQSESRCGEKIVIALGGVTGCIRAETVALTQPITLQTNALAPADRRQTTQTRFYMQLVYRVITESSLSCRVTK